MKVHNQLGNGFQEKIYQKCLAIELSDSKIGFLREVNQPIFYKNQKVGERRADFIVEDCLMIELKAIIDLEDAHLAQGLNYLTAYNLEIGSILEIRVCNTKDCIRKMRTMESNPANLKNPIIKVLCVE